MLVELSWSSMGSALLFEFRDDALRQDFAELDAPLVERIDVPDDALGEHAVLVQRDQLAQRFRRRADRARIVFDGRLPSKTRCGTSQSGVPSAFTCSGVLPNASASVWANTLASSMS